jgi:glucose-1-phosphate cytidylyltransferase
MKVVILAGGFGTRISEYTRFIPKPMIRIKGLPILVHIMKHYSKFGIMNFILHLVIKEMLLKIILKIKNLIGRLI